MKIINSISKISKKEKLEHESIKDLEEGITKTLLEKYRPKYLYDTKDIIRKEDQRRVA